MSGKWWTSLLECPECAGRFPGDRTACTCGERLADGRFDFRLERTLSRQVTLTAGNARHGRLAEIDTSRPVVDDRGPRTIRDSSELFAALNGSPLRGGRMLDLGCGPRDQEAVATHHGLHYVGIDFHSDAADLLADAHAIPFASASFDLVFSYAVLEHLANPILAAREVHRVLRRGGIFLGTVSQGEPFHDSFFHHTAFGVLQLLEDAGLRVDRLWPSYDTLHALSTMGRYSRVTKSLIALLHRFDRATPFLSPRAILRRDRKAKQLEALHRAAGICFVARAV